MTELQIIERLTESFASVIPKSDKRTKISHLNFIVYMVFSFLGDSKQWSIAGLRRNLITQTGLKISRGSFWERLSGNRLRKMLESLVEKLMAQSVGSALVASQILDKLGVISIFLHDASTITLLDAAKKKFPGTGNKAGIKLHSCSDLFSGKQHWFRLSASRKHDRNYFPPFELLKNSLIIFDLGYFDYQLMIDLMAAKVFFLCRLKSNSVVFIKEIVIGLHKKQIGKSLLTACHVNQFQGAILEAIVQATTKNNTIMTCRAIGFWNNNEKRYHWYLSNLAVEAKIIYSLYRLRWQIELLFKASKSVLNMDAISSANENIIQSLLLASMAAHLSSQTVYEIALHALSTKEYLAISFQRIAFVLVNLKEKFIRCILNPLQENSENLVRSIHHMKNELFDPNYKKRETSKDRIYWLLMNEKIKSA